LGSMPYLGEDATGYTHAVKIEALAQLGYMLKGMEKNVGTRNQLAGKSSGGAKVEPLEKQPPTLAELGIDKKTSMAAQQLDNMPEDVREKIANQEKSMKEIPGVTEV